MKKIFSFLMVFIVLLCSFGSVQAMDYNAKNYFEVKFVEFCTDKGCDMTAYNYDELFYHYDDNEETDWCLISADCSVEPGTCHAVFDDIIITNAGSLYPFQFGLAVYDVANNEFYDICQAWDMDFTQLHEAFFNVMTDKNISYAYGNIQILGDVDKNGVLNIADATLIQKYLAELVPRNDMLDIDFSSIKYGFNLTCLSDYNKDGFCTVEDATYIQKRLSDVDSN
ncbi:MAG: dockerin type I repeat-containing protein [Ruminococcus sp.]